MDREDRIAFVRRFLAARLEDPLEDVAGFFTGDAVYRIIGGSHFGPFAGPFVGASAIRDALYRLSVNFKFVDVKPALIMADGDHVAVRWNGRWENRGTGEGACMEGFAHIVLRDGRIAEYSNFLDSATVAEFAGW